ncbi:hypothetical protein [Nitratireductor basaltis]|uniref:Bile acid:sodium symporter n=1 Tax=Nitratireductor basaltis TaxID=472175 RepID=A0A084UBC6_9HYPH|nr:hypothetical protein [Nitratireductor basaltis]KFB10262.1 hypothetical protein EL18_01293 [Nitratireductor basaltis]
MALAVLDRAARHAHWLLVAGLLVGIASPTLALMLKPWIAEMIAAMLFLAALRVGPRKLIGAGADFSRSLCVALVLQLALPVGLYFSLTALGVQGPILLGLMLMSAAAPISGSPNLAIIMGGDPAPSLRLLAVATAILPLTAIPVFWLSPALGTPGEIFAAAARLLAVIAIAVAAAFLVRAKFLPDPDLKQTRMIDGLSAILMAAVVVGLMSAVGETLLENPRLLAFNLAVAFAANLVLQIVALLVARRFFNATDSVAFAIAAGNRNIALFLTALPVAVTDPLLLFIGCFQIPMYLTPMMMGRIYRRATSGQGA